MENFIFDKEHKGIGKKDILYAGAYAVLISIVLVFGYVLLFGVDVANCNLIRLCVSYFVILIASWIILLIRKC